MEGINKWLERFYEETDFGRSVAISLTGIVGLGTYLLFKDWVISLFSSVIVFPAFRLIASWIHQKSERTARQQLVRKEAEKDYEKLTEKEKEIVSAFVNAGSTVLTWTHVNSLSLYSPAIESLIQRDILSTSMTADSLRETFVLDSAIFDAARNKNIVVSSK